MNRILFFLIPFLLIVAQAGGTTYRVTSPGNKVEATLDISDKIWLSVKLQGETLLAPSSIGMIIDDRMLGDREKVLKTERTIVDRIITPPVNIKSETITEQYNEIEIFFKNNFSLVVRVYDEGAAYRFKTSIEGDIVVNREAIELNLDTTTFAYLMVEKSFSSMSESPYVTQPIGSFDDGTLVSLPSLFKTDSGKFLLVTESDLKDYPGLWLTKSNGMFRGTLPGRVMETRDEKCTDHFVVTKRADHLAQCKGNRVFPWRVFIVAESERDLPTNPLVYLLSTPPEEADYSWIVPGMATLDWWGRRNIYNTDFAGGVNTETHQYFVDFNAKYGIEYFVLDDGWSNSCDLRDINPHLDIDALREYADKKNVGLVYWMHAYALNEDIAGYLDFLKAQGARGIKVDFFIRDDQDAVNLMHEIAGEALKRKIVVDFHGICKPFGLNRTYPNVLSSEGLVEFEMNGVTNWANPAHHTLLPFIRMVTGPMDYLPGTFRNAQQEEFCEMPNRPMGLGSRAHAIALAVILESPLVMIPDSPSDYLKEDASTRFLCSIPTVWDETVVVDAKIGEYIVMARRRADKWYLAAITNWEERALHIHLGFLEEKEYLVDYIGDGVNTNRRAIDYKRAKRTVKGKENIEITLSKGGGWIGIITDKSE